MDDSESTLAATAAGIEAEFDGRWGIWLSDTGQWWATRRQPLSADDLAAGCVPYLQADSLDKLAANAVVHTASGKGGMFTVVVRPGDGVIRVEVHDSGSETFPDVRSTEDLAGSGRGLGLVESLATRWGHLGDRDGRIVWFEVEWQ